MQASREEIYVLATLAVFEVFEKLLNVGFPRLDKERGRRPDHADSKPSVARGMALRHAPALSAQGAFTPVLRSAVWPSRSVALRHRPSAVCFSLG